jgi:bifunctional NMN adenylyltransferase/nudix hydrolase
MNEVGVVIGRFQVADLHEGHRYLVNEAFRHHKKVIILIGCAPIQGTKYDPLDYPTRERMLRAAYPDAFILPIYDCLDDLEWSRNVDKAIKGIVPNLTGASLYGGRNSFKEHYKGEYHAVDVDSGIRYQSGRDQREDIGKVVRSSSDFRAGIIYSTQNAWPYVKMCVDIACIKYTDPNNTSLLEPLVLLGRKANENRWRLPGGMVDKGEDLEIAASRELREETGNFEFSALKYLGSAPVGDWRFKNAGEIGLLTALFVTEYLFGHPHVGDDLIELKWCPIKQAEDEVVKGHKTLISALKEYLNDK